MKFITGRNVDDILSLAAEDLLSNSIVQQTRNGRVQSYPGVFATQVDTPWERVLFNPWRKINPFLHLVDGLSILSRIDSVKPLGDIVKRFYEYSDDGVTLRGHYGRRLADQIPLALDLLNEDALSRRVVMKVPTCD